MGEFISIVNEKTKCLLNDCNFQNIKGNFLFFQVLGKIISSSMLV